MKAKIHPLSPILKTAGLKNTPARLRVLELLSSAEKPLSIQKILKGFKDSKIDLVTVYRITEAFKKAGIVREVNLEHGHAHFELSTKEHHHHIICEKCGRVEDLSNCGLEYLESKVLRNTNFSTINRHALEFFGLCTPCSKKSKSA